MTETDVNLEVIHLIPDMYDKDVNIADRIFSYGCLHHVNGETQDGKGPEVVKASIKGINANFSDSRTVFDEIISGGTRVAVRWTWTGKSLQTGELWEFRGNTIFHLDAGKVVEYWAIDNRYNEMQRRQAAGPS